MPKDFHKIPSERPKTPLLDQVSSPSLLRKLDKKQLATLCHEIRAYLLYSVGQSGGHFGAGLGAVEITVALHYIFNTPEDSLLFDVGHQCYPHKILTKRREELLSIRSLGGLTPFLDPEESPYDTLKAGHAGTALGTALGIAIANQAQNQQKKTIAVVGDGALTCGQTLEALNHGGHIGKELQLILILNDNQMSISPNIGRLNQKDIFKQLGWRYEGPVDGHNILELCSKLEVLKEQKGVSVLHVHTQKGKGFLPAENDPVRYHAINKIIPLREQTQNTKKRETYSHVFGETLLELMGKDEKICVITPAMIEGSGLKPVLNAFPKRVYDVGIAEQHAITLAAGLSMGGLKPIVAIYSTFLQRALDQIIHDLCLGGHNVTLAIDRSGLVGEDGPSHHGFLDIALLRAIPSITLMAPSSTLQLKEMLQQAIDSKGVQAIRFPRGEDKPILINNPPFEKNHGAMLYEPKGAKGVILNFGALLNRALSIGKSLNLAVADLRMIKPLDSLLLRQLCEHYPLWISIEEHSTQAGAGSAVLEWLCEHKQKTPLLPIGLPDTFLPHGSIASLHQNLLDEKTLYSQIKNFLSNEL